MNCGNCGDSRWMKRYADPHGGYVWACEACQNAKKREWDAVVASGQRFMRPLSMNWPQLSISVSGKELEYVPRATAEQLHSSERLKRLNSNKMTLYHQTAEEYAKIIVSTQQMSRGNNGLASGGIYFATSAWHTSHKAVSKGVILQATVLLGRVKEVAKNGEPVSLTQLTNEGYDSVLIPRDNGKEYVVYHSEQVVNISYY